MSDKVTPRVVSEMVAGIKAKENDDEAAHSAEDGLYLYVLQAIADGECTDIKECARIALTMQDLDFERLCA